MKHINLIPLEARKLTAPGWIKRYILKSPIYRVTISILVLLFLIFIYEVSASARYRLKISLQKKQINKLQVQLERNKDTQERIKRESEIVQEANKHIQKRISFLEGARTEAVKWSDVLLLLSKLTPPDLWLSKISLNKEAIAINGTTLDNARVSDFMLKIDESRYFKATSFNFTQKNKAQPGEAIMDFEIITHLARY
jgi:Tfp pilus assembly protein PilN